MDLRILAPGVFVVMGLALGTILWGDKVALADPLLLAVGGPTVVTIAGWLVYQGFRYWWTWIGIYHNSIYHKELRAKTNFVKRRADSNTEERYDVYLYEIGLANLLDLPKPHFQTLFDPFRERWLFLKWSVPRDRQELINSSKLPYVASLDNYILYASSIRDTPGRFWTSIMVFFQAIIGLTLGASIGWILQIRVGPDHLLVLGFLDEYWPAKILVSGVWGVVLGLPAVAQAVLVSYREALAYELLAVLLLARPKGGNQTS